MSAREQTAWDEPPVLRTHRVPVTDRQRIPARKGAGHQAGIHPEDEPYYTTGQPAKRARADVELYEPPRMPTVVRKYHQPATQVAEEVPVRRLLPAHFFLTAMGVLLLVIVLALFLTMYVFPALRSWNDDRPTATRARSMYGLTSGMAQPQRRTVILWPRTCAAESTWWRSAKAAPPQP